ncbi:44214_t:CDS:2, partial [Gigaspora margarita]
SFQVTAPFLRTINRLQRFIRKSHVATLLVTDAKIECFNAQGNQVEVNFASDLAKGSSKESHMSLFHEDLQQIGYLAIELEKVEEEDWGQQMDYLLKEWVQVNMYYWYCEKRKLNECKGHATTAFLNNLHYLKKFNDHNHALQASSAEVARSIASIRDRAHETNDQLAQIIQNTIINIPKEIYPYVPSHNALRI